MGGQETPDTRIAALARYGVVDRAGLLAAGVTRREIDRRLARGRLHLVHRGVYAVGHPWLSPEGRWLAAVLAGGEGAVLSHWSAAALWRLIEVDPALPHITAEGRLRPAGVVAHRGSLLPADRGLHRGIPVTSVAHTLLDMAGELDDSGFERLVREAQFRRLFSVAAVEELLARRRCRRLRELLDDFNPSQSRLEDAFLRLCRRHRIPAPEAQVRGRRRRPDFVWREARLIVEVDSWSGHGNPVAFQADRTLSNAVQLAGWRILRFTWADVTRRPEEVARQVRRALGI
jgi:very-short-patch-repair endonuclease